MKEEWVRLRGALTRASSPRPCPSLRGAMAIVLADHLLRRMAWVGFENAR